MQAEVAAVLHAMDDGAPTQFSIATYRANINGMSSIEAVMGPTVPVGSKETIAIPTDAGGDEGGVWKAGEISCNVYKPEGAGNEPLAALVYFHGGGYVVGTPELTDNVTRYVCKEANMIVFSVDYRYGPEFEYPQATEDCYAATKWVADNAASLGVDPARIAIGGDSAGGNAAAVVAMMSRDRDGPKIALNWLLNPWIDLDLQSWPEYESYNKFHTLGFFKGPFHLVWMAMNYLGSGYQKKGQEDYCSPTRAGGTVHADLSGLPKTINAVFGADPLHDMGVALAVGETDILLHPPVPLSGVSIGINRGCHQNDSLADG